MPRSHQVFVFDGTRSERSVAGGPRPNAKNESSFKLTYNNLSETIGPAPTSRLDSARQMQMKLAFVEAKCAY